MIGKVMRAQIGECGRQPDDKERTDTETDDRFTAVARGDLKAAKICLHGSFLLALLQYRRTVSYFFHPGPQRGKDRDRGRFGIAEKIPRFPRLELPHFGEKAAV